MRQYTHNRCRPGKETCWHTPIGVADGGDVVRRKIVSLLRAPGGNAVHPETLIAQIRSSVCCSLFVPCQPEKPFLTGQAQFSFASPFLQTDCSLVVAAAALFCRSIGTGTTAEIGTPRRRSVTVRHFLRKGPCGHRTLARSQPLQRILRPPHPGTPRGAARFSCTADYSSPCPITQG